MATAGRERSEKDRKSAAVTENTAAEEKTLRRELECDFQRSSRSTKALRTSLLGYPRSLRAEDARLAAHPVPLHHPLDLYWPRCNPAAPLGAENAVVSFLAETSTFDLSAGRLAGQRQRRRTEMAATSRSSRFRRMSSARSISSRDRSPFVVLR